MEPRHATLIRSGRPRGPTGTKRRLNEASNAKEENSMGNVLIVDDSSTMRKIISRSLRQAGLQVDDIYEAGDGIEGLSTMEGKTIDLILSDINMPNMDGLEFIKAVRAKGISVPIVMITTEGGEDILKEAMSSGASDSIKKPFTPDQLNEKLGGLL
jgi:two-component system, chemotaxis family, chemotaxis protein CheY